MSKAKTVRVKQGGEMSKAKTVRVKPGMLGKAMAGAAVAVDAEFLPGGVEFPALLARLEQKRALAVKLSAAMQVFFERIDSHTRRIGDASWPRAGDLADALQDFLTFDTDQEAVKALMQQAAEDAKRPSRRMRRVPGPMFTAEDLVKAVAQRDVFQAQADSLPGFLEEMPEKLRNYFESFMAPMVNDGLQRANEYVAFVQSCLESEANQTEQVPES
jgi:hypothetical protein